MVQKSFGTGGTFKKLETISDYLQFYTRALNGKFKLTYLDPFAGTGEVPIRGSLPLLDGVVEYEKFLAGSARMAFSVRPAFDRYVISDLKKAHASSLLDLQLQYPDIVERVTITQSEANQAVADYCKIHNPVTDRAVIFLDPFGNQVKWSTIELIAQTKGIDLWYLFPAGLGVARQISDDGTVQMDAESSLNEMFGDRSWFESATQLNTQMDLLSIDVQTRTKVADTADAVTRQMIRKMKSVFKGVVLDEWLRLGKKGGHWYSLLFAISNDSKPAKELARRVAKDIMRTK
jgi:three-Cys-motif partner protein